MPGYFVRTRRRLRSRSLLGEPQHRLRLSTKAPALENEKAGRELAARAVRARVPVLDAADSTATKRPTYSSWSATILLTGTNLHVNQARVGEVQMVCI